MKETKWFYGSEDKKLGPVTMGELKALVESGRMHSGVMICQEGTRNWKPIEEWPQFAHGNIDEPVSEDSKHRTWEEEGYHAKEDLHPWHRLWARMFDYVVFSCGLVTILRIFGMGFRMHPIINGLIIFFLWVFIEAILMSTWGKTPGKALFNITVTSAHGAQLNFSQALRRSIMVWWFGIAIGLPLVSLITPIIAYIRLKKKQSTYWDSKGYFRVQHQPLGPIKRVVATIFIIVFISILFLNVAAVIMQYRQARGLS